MWKKGIRISKGAVFLNKDNTFPWLFFLSGYTRDSVYTIYEYWKENFFR